MFINVTSCSCIFTMNQTSEDLNILELFSGIGGMHFAFKSESIMIKTKFNEINKFITFRELNRWKNICGNRYQ